MTARLKWESQPSGVLRCVGTVVWNELTRHAVVIDPTDDPSTFQGFLDRNDLRLKEVLLTHAHVDHAAGACDIAQAAGLTPRLHRDDWELFRDAPRWGLNFGMEVPAPSLSPVELLHDEWIDVEDGFRLHVIHTPGHTPGQVAFHIPEISLVVVGDTLFFGSVGRTDLPGGSFPQLEHSIRTRLYDLPDATVVVPGHGPRTTIGREKRENPYVRD
ncbi:MAG: MBL fold metallo-hydrolase [Fibrobacteria bacterium]|nr:MBL fold metallo-hydrolase [Fibrobacteria bacterium]